MTATMIAATISHVVGNSVIGLSSVSTLGWVAALGALAYGILGLTVVRVAIREATVAANAASTAEVPVYKNAA
jgi:hypothetical protein